MAQWFAIVVSRSGILRDPRTTVENVVVAFLRTAAQRAKSVCDCVPYSVSVKFQIFLRF